MAETIASYHTIETNSEGTYSESRSKFLAFLVPVANEDEALSQVAAIRQKYHDARHVCWAYRLGASGQTTRSSDDGEPSGTAGKPILGQLLSHNLTMIVAIVVRYFGGVKLGTSGLIEAYRNATSEAIATATVVERIVEQALEVRFGYDLMGEVMRLVKDADARITKQEFVESCMLRLSLRADHAPALYSRLDALYGLSVRWIEGGA